MRSKKVNTKEEVSKKSTTVVENVAEALKPKTKRTGRTAKSTVAKTEKAPAKKTKAKKAEAAEPAIQAEIAASVKEKKPATAKSKAKKEESVAAAEKKQEVVLPDLHGVKIIPLGGLEQIGMNITAYEYEDSAIWSMTC